ncbi:glycosyltransferase family 4 protein [Frankia sp. CIT1]|uniref:glycosyltransferase family 4 protein n=1 Tax=Frankia sp. CIT1 TaxID=2880974 RepID=UPI001EF5051F|nr:glycosyltransferase family 4 protein [Frankia sp. CIT1]
MTAKATTQRLRVLLITHYFPPEVGAPQARLAETAREWAADGVDVTVLTGMPNHPTGIIPPEYRGAWRRVEHRDGYRVVRTWVYATPNKGIVRRTLGHLSFMVTSVLLGGNAAGGADVIVVSSPTFFPLGSAWLLARLRRARLVVEVRDLWPAIFVQLGVLRNRRVIAVLERLELAAYRAADAVVTVTDGFRDDIIGRGIPARKVHTIHNGADLRRFSPSDPPSAALGARSGDTLVVYIGAHGISQGLPSVVDTAAELVGEPVHIAFVGEGADRQRVADRVAERGLTNVTMHAAVRHDEVAGIVAAADICLVPLRDVPLFTTFIPSKMFELLAAGRPVIGALAGEAARILAAAGGVVVPPEDPTALADAIRSLAGDPHRRKAMGVAGRAYVTDHFDRAVLARRYRTLLEEVTGRSAAVPKQRTANVAEPITVRATAVSPPSAIVQTTDTGQRELT